VSIGGDGRLDGLVNREHLGQTGDPEDLQDALLRAYQVQRAVVGAYPLQTSDQDAQTGGVKELHAGHVHHDVVSARIDQLRKLLAQPRSRIYIDLAGDFHDGPAVLRPGRQRQIHWASFYSAGLSHSTTSARTGSAVGAPDLPTPAMPAALCPRRRDASGVLAGCDTADV